MRMLQTAARRLPCRRHILDTRLRHQPEGPTIPRTFSTTQFVSKYTLPPPWPSRSTASSKQAPPAADAEALSLRDRIRLSMRLLTHPVAIITSPSPGTAPALDEQNQQPGRTTGLIVSSFNTVSLDAADGPIVSFNLKVPSKTFDAIKAAGSFDVSFPHDEGVCDAFASPAKRDALGAEELRARLDAGTVFRYRCEWLEGKSVRVADHVIMVGRICGYEVGDVVDAGKVPRDMRPLSYHDGDFET